MTKWSTEQDDILRRFGNHGPEECARIIERECGVKRTPEAVRRHAYRIGASIVEYRICTGCGRKARKVNRDDGLCDRCHHRRLSEECKRRNAVILRERDDPDEEGVADARRDYAKQRQQVSRLRRKLGLSGKA